MNDLDMQKMIASLSQMNKSDLGATLKKTMDTNNISQDTVNNLLKTLGNNNTNTSSPNSQPSNQNTSNNIDMETMLKMQSMINGMNNQNDPRSNLLASLKPYLKENGQNKLDQYMRFYAND